MNHSYTLTEEDFDRLEAGEEIIAECDKINDEKHQCKFTGIRIKWAWSKEEMESIQKAVLQK